MATKYTIEREPVFKTPSSMTAEEDNGSVRTYGPGRSESTSMGIHASFPAQGKSQPAHLGSQSSSPSKDVESESGAINN